jgi:eukaryotic-like serine/threonine-protein kinase
VGVVQPRPAGVELQPDDRVGIYRIVRRIAPAYYDAEDALTHRRITIETGTRDDSRLVDVRFVRAQALLDPLSHPGIAQILDHGTLGDDRPWVAAQRPHGASLSELFAQGRLTHDEASALVRGAAGVLAYVHAHSIVHGHLRPHQIIVIDDDPFATTPISIGGWASLRSPGIPAFGDPPAINVYVAPEHLHGPIDQRADLYTLGAIAYRGLTGVFPDVARDLLGTGDPLGAMVNAMLAPDPRDRPSADEVFVALLTDSPTGQHQLSA